MKEQLIKDFLDKKFPGLCIIDIYLINRQYFGELIKKNKVTKDMETYLKKNEQNFRQIYEQCSVHAFRKLQYQKVIDEQYEECPKKQESADKKTKKNENKKNHANKKSLKAKSSKGKYEQRSLKSQEDYIRSVTKQRREICSARGAWSAAFQSKVISEECSIKKADKERSIEFSDFVIRRNVFGCAKKNHELKDILASMMVINRNNKEECLTIPAGYCKECNLYFILESNYQKIKRNYIPICRVVSEKVYLKGADLHGKMNLADESILMQYGYNVSQTEGLSDETRKKILSCLMDQGMSKSTIISYLDFFINQRLGRTEYAIAISKWTRDKKFVVGYKSENVQRYGVSSIIDKRYM